MAPATWNDEEFISGGLKGITKFNGQLTEIEEDIEGLYGDQMALYFDECTVLESAEEVSLEDGKYTDWIKQTNKKNSVNQMFVQHIKTFITHHKLKGGVPDALYGVDITWERLVVLEGNEDKGMSPGMCLVPVALVGQEAPAKGRRASAKTEEEPAAPPRRRRRAAPDPEPEDEEPPATEGDDGGEPTNVPSELTEFVLGIIGEDGATRDLIRRDVTKKTALRKLQTAAGGLDTVLAHMVEAESIVEEDGTYFPNEEE